MFVLNMHLVFVHRTRVRSQIIYSITLLAVILAIGALPFLYITISVKGEGIIKSNLEKIELLAPASGRILNLNLKDNQKVIKGISATATGTNLFTWTNYKGMDPEIASVDNQATPAFIDLTYNGGGGFYPKSRSLTIGVNISFK